MNAVLWVLQAILSVKLLSTALSHGLQQGKPQIREGIERMGPAGRPLLVGSALLLVGGCLAVLAAAAADVPRWLTPVAAAGLGGMALASIPLHLNCREQPNVFVSVVLGALAAVVAYGRWTISPL